MSVLLLRLAGPMQSWGTRSRFTNRDTGLEPSRSGVIGLLCAALGRPRDEPLDDFLPLKMAVRVDREGRLMRDFHTARDVRRADPTKGTQETVVSERFYLADADFLVGLEGDRAFLDRLDAALRHPVWPLFLGRKSFVPSLPVSEGVIEGTRLDVLQRHPWRKRYRGENEPAGRLRGLDEVPYGTGEPRQDVPLSFVSRDRRFTVRHVQLIDFEPPPILDPDLETPRVPQQADPQSLSSASPV
jgi:CRISPR system Cascade subunit CasD